MVAAQRAWRGAVAVRRAQAALLVAQLSALEAAVWRAQQAAARGGEPGADAPMPAWGAFAARGAAVAATRRERVAGEEPGLYLGLGLLGRFCGARCGVRRHAPRAGRG